jgi:DNA-binding NtrC family response regulator
MTTKILVVDDETDLQSLIKQKFRRENRNMILFSQSTGRMHLIN